MPHHLTNYQFIIYRFLLLELCINIIQVCLEGAISQGTVMKSLARGKRNSGDLIPWTLSQQFVDHEFAGLSGARIVRIATHPDYQGVSTLSNVISYVHVKASTLCV